MCNFIGRFFSFNGEHKSKFKLLQAVLTDPLSVRLSCLQCSRAICEKLHFLNLLLEIPTENWRLTTVRLDAECDL